jgi:hypothetical protein
MIYIKITTNNDTTCDIDFLQTSFNGPIVNHIRVFSFPSFVVDVENSEFFNARTLNFVDNYVWILAFIQLAEFDVDSLRA